MPKKLDDLPNSEDKEFWGEDALTYISKGKKIPLCNTHGKKWADHVGYIENRDAYGIRDGTATCKFCGWGFIIPGYMRILDEKVVDLRKL